MASQSKDLAPRPLHPFPLPFLPSSLPPTTTTTTIIAIITTRKEMTPKLRRNSDLSSVNHGRSVCKEKSGENNSESVNFIHNFTVRFDLAVRR